MQARYKENKPLNIESPKLGQEEIVARRKRKPMNLKDEKGNLYRFIMILVYLDFWNG